MGEEQCGSETRTEDLVRAAAVVWLLGGLSLGLAVGLAIGVLFAA